MKKSIALLATVFMALSLTACTTQPVNPNGGDIQNPSIQQPVESLEQTPVDGTISFQNNSTSDITEIKVAASGAEDWTANLLPADYVLLQGTETNVAYDAYTNNAATECDIMLVTSTGKTLYLLGMDLQNSNSVELLDAGMVSSRNAQ